MALMGLNGLITVTSNSNSKEPFTLYLLILGLMTFARWPLLPVYSLGLMSRALSSRYVAHLDFWPLRTLIGCCCLFRT